MMTIIQKLVVNIFFSTAEKILYFWEKESQVGPLTVILNVQEMVFRSTFRVHMTWGPEGCTDEGPAAAPVMSPRSGEEGGDAGHHRAGAEWRVLSRPFLFELNLF